MWTLIIKVKQTGVSRGEIHKNVGAFRQFKIGLVLLHMDGKKLF